MTSTFMGLEIAKRGMTTQQNALYVTSQNVANANTPGYSRQRVDFEATEAYPFPSMNREQIPGQMGTGVKAGSIQRVREKFLDVQYRTENNKVGYYQAKSDALSQMESIMNEPSDSGLANTMDQFWQSLQDLAVDPTNSGARSVVRQRGEAVADTFNYLYNTLTDVQQDQKNQIDLTAKNINSLLTQLDGLNQQIARVEPNGMLPNDLYDQRDKLIDELSSFANITVQYTPPTTGIPAVNAEGIATISFVDDSGQNPVVALDSTGVKSLSITYGGTNGDGPVSQVTIGGNDFDFKNSTGKLKALVESYGYDDGSGKTIGIYPDMLNELDNMAYTFASQFNDVHMKGLSPYDLDPANTPEETPFFTDDLNNAITTSTSKTGLAGKLKVSNEIKTNLDKIATATSQDPVNNPKDPAGVTIGDASNAYRLADVINQNYNYGQNGDLTNFRNYYQNIIGAMGVDAQEANRLAQNSTSLQQAVDERRQSVSSVSLDEEMTNMIQFQHAYSASAKMISIQDEILDTIINGMGVGR